jgi:AcrR family transcriptional regulator
VTLREVAERIGMRSPSLYTHFDSKNAIYDAMFAQAWTELVDLFDALEHPTTDREGMLVEAEAFFDFAAADLARYQLMNQRTIPGFRPSEEAYRRVRGRLRAVPDRDGQARRVRAGRPGPLDGDHRRVRRSAARK